MLKVELRKTHVILIPGFNVRDGGEASVGKMAPYFKLEGCTTEIFDYGYFNLFAPRWRNKMVAERLAERIADINATEYDCVVLAHSNGATITHIAGNKFGAKIDRVVYINPALDNWVSFPESFASYDVWHNPHDRVVSLARFIPFHLWGDMGRWGSTRYDKRGRNWNMINYIMGRINPHSRSFSDEISMIIAPIIVQTTLTER